MEQTPDSAAHLLQGARLNLIRRTADGSLRMSADRWFFTSYDAGFLRFRSEPTEDVETMTLAVDLNDVESLSWDRLPKQTTRSQVRLHFRNGDLWTFSGRLHAPDESGTGSPEVANG